MKRGHDKFVFMILVCLTTAAVTVTAAESSKVFDSNGNPLKELTSYRIQIESSFEPTGEHIGLLQYNCPPYVVLNNVTVDEDDEQPWRKRKFPSFQFQVKDLNKHEIFVDTPVYIKADDETYEEFGKVCTTDPPVWQLVKGDLTTDEELWYVKTGGNIGSDFGQKPKEFKFVESRTPYGVFAYKIQHVDSGRNVGFYFRKTGTGIEREFLAIDTKDDDHTDTGSRVDPLYVSFKLLDDEKKEHNRPTAFSAQASI